MDLAEPCRQCLTPNLRRKWLCLALPQIQAAFICMGVLSLRYDVLAVEREDFSMRSGFTGKDTTYVSEGIFLERTLKEGITYRLMKGTVGRRADN